MSFVWRFFCKYLIVPEEMAKGVSEENETKHAGLIFHVLNQRSAIIKRGISMAKKARHKLFGRKQLSENSNMYGEKKS